MKYACLVYHDGKTPDIPEPELDARGDSCGAWVGDLKNAGRYVFSAGLEPAGNATTVRSRSDSVSVVDGPYAETKEFLAGFTIIEARDLNEAIHEASRLAACSRSTVEVRPVLSLPTD
jgi:hypothetical protein